MKIKDFITSDLDYNNVYSQKYYINNKYFLMSLNLTPEQLEIDLHPRLIIYSKLPEMSFDDMVKRTQELKAKEKQRYQNLNEKARKRNVQAAIKYNKRNKLSGTDYYDWRHKDLNELFLDYAKVECRLKKQRFIDQNGELTEHAAIVLQEWINLCT